MSDQADPAANAVELFKAITHSLGDNAPNNAEELLKLYDRCLQHVGYTNSNRQNDSSRTTR
jgi:uncharacterized protein YPO0396